MPNMQMPFYKSPNPVTTYLWTRATTLWLFLLRQDIKLAKVGLQVLCHHNLLSTGPILDPKGPVVSLTTHGDRVNTVYLAIESIASGTVLPSRLILWLDNVEAYKKRPTSLRRLEERGLEVLLSPNYGPHTKYYPYVTSTDCFDKPLITADDDVLYTRSWLSGLVRAYQHNSEVINCYRAHVIRLSSGSIAPYKHWRRCESNKPSARNFATGVSGCIYPPKFLDALRTAGDQFLRASPKADDVWLNVNALRAGFKVRQIGCRPLNYPFVPSTQDGGLWHTNVGLDQNDAQIATTYRREDIIKLVAEAARPEVDREHVSISTKAHIGG